MAEITNSFHSSSRKHSISNASKLSQVEAHNDRGYLSWEYDQSKIHSLIGESDRITDDVVRYIKEKFAPAIDIYNDNQKRNDRKIKTDAFTFFEGNKKLDIANEVIFQIGDKDFWERFRAVKRVVKNDKVYYIKSFPAEIKKVMDEIYIRQAEAYEKIYQTDKEKILEKVKEAKENAAAVLSTFSEDEKECFGRIMAMKNKAEKKEKIAELSEEDGEKYARYFEAMSEYSSIEKQHLIERIENDEIEIKIINLTSHYDEWSPHAHGISVCSAKGYTQGLPERVAKSVAINKYSLEVLQDKMHEIALDEINKHPEIFYETGLQEKKKGRTLNLDKEDYIRYKQKKLVKDVDQLQLQISEKEQNIMMLNESIREKREEVEEWDRILMEVGDEKEYVAEAEKANSFIDLLLELVNKLVERVGFTRDRDLEEEIYEKVNKLYIALTESLKKLRLYEVRERVSEEERKSEPIVAAKKKLDEMITSAQGQQTSSSAFDQPKFNPADYNPSGFNGHQNSDPFDRGGK